MEYPSSRSFPTPTFLSSGKLYSDTKVYKNFSVNRSISCWGDSLTEGAGVSPTFPTLMAANMEAGRTVFNGGVGGETSTQILNRFLTGSLSDIAVIWAGRNDISNGTPTTTIKGNIATMVNSITSNPKQFVVVSIHNRSIEPTGNSTGDAIIALNIELSGIYQQNYFDSRSYLQARGDGGATDNADISSGIVPTSLRADNLHLNTSGHGFVSEGIISFIKDKGW